ncbi:lema family protein [Variovorax dokdonensis]|uniref:Lema family protein n=1 Tax=Variovorax dokdonensis TaxID=344883 RepID=A0ABT7NAW5_9BURK|nr:lema family protein [Variovorax dokdonensis]MDM0045005.1 lema family protein [Variovorax dokdonensis]
MSDLRELIPASFGWWLAGAVLIFWFVGAHNRLVRLRSAALVAYGALDAALARQVDYARSRVADDANLDAGSALVAAAAQTSAMMSAARQKPLEPNGVEALGTALTVLLDAWERIFPGEAVSFDAEGTLSRPASLASSVREVGTLPGDPLEFSATSPPLAWPEPSAAAEIARAQFNLAVSRYNRAISQFPAMLIAWAFRLHRAAPLL